MITFLQQKLQISMSPNVQAGSEAEDLQSESSKTASLQNKCHSCAKAAKTKNQLEIHASSYKSLCLQVYKQTVQLQTCNQTAPKQQINTNNCH